MESLAQASGRLQVPGGPEVTRMGYGAMRLTGPGIWGPPKDPDEAIRVLRRTVELGIDFIDTADSYGPFVSENLVREALHPYDGVVIATKGGQLRPRPGEWVPCGIPAYLRQCVETSLRRLDVETIPLYQLHRIDRHVPLEEQVGVLDEMRQEGKLRAIGLSEVTVDQLEQARAVTSIASVQNRYNLADRSSHDVLERCEGLGLAFIPWAPIAASKLATAGGEVARIAEELGATPSQVSLAWLLATSPVMLPIPGTSSVAHLEENTAAAGLELSDKQLAALDGVASSRRG